MKIERLLLSLVVLLGISATGKLLADACSGEQAYACQCPVLDSYSGCAGATQEDCVADKTEEPADGDWCKEDVDCQHTRNGTTSTSVLCYTEYGCHIVSASCGKVTGGGDPHNKAQYVSRACKNHGPNDPHNCGD